MSVNNNSKSHSDTPQKEAFADFLKKVQGVDPSTISTKHEEVDVVAEIGGKIKYFELKTSEKSLERLKKYGYFGAATITEWSCAIKHPNDFYFVYVIGDEGNGYKYMIVKAEDLLSYASVPPFKININMRIGDYLKNFKEFKSSEEIYNIDDEVIRIPEKKRKKSQVSFGVNNLIIKQLNDYYYKQRELYLKTENEKR